MRTFFALCLSAAVLLLPAVLEAAGTYGVPVNGFPSWRERSVQAFANACRMDPTGFRDAYLQAPGILTPAMYPKTAPVYWDLGLNQAARAHTTDLGTHPECPLSHRSCDGTSFVARLGHYYPDSPNIGENIAAGTLDALSALVLWLRDDFGSGPPPDGQGDTNRFVIMNRLFHEVGGGHASSSGTYADYWVMDFGGGAPIGNPLVDGTHALAQGGMIAFFANFYDPGAGSPRSASLVLDGLMIDMTLFFGVAVQGTYQVRVPRATACRSYYFLFEGGDGRSWRYPEKGQFLTAGEGNCTAEYQPASGTGNLQLAGDCNQDGALDLSDSLCLLGAMFLGTPPRFPCGGGSAAEASNIALLDLNGDGRIDIADGIYGISFLFLGGSPPHQGTGCYEIPGCVGACAGV